MKRMPCHEAREANCSGMSDAAIPPTKTLSACPFATLRTKSILCAMRENSKEKRRAAWGDENSKVTTMILYYATFTLLHYNNLVGLLRTYRDG